MSTDHLVSCYQQILYKEFGSSCVLVSAAPVSGGCINNGVILGTSQGSYFLKWNSDDVADMFDKEFQGLEILREQRVIPIPEPYFTGNIPGVSYLILEYVESGRRSPDFWRNFGLLRFQCFFGVKFNESFLQRRFQSFFVQAIFLQTIA